MTEMFFRQTFRRILLSLVVAFALAGSTPALALAPGQWDSETRLWLARAMVAEAGFTASEDHVAIAYVLAHRFSSLRERWPTIRFVDVIRAYCAGLGGRSFTRRQQWVRELALDGEEPEGWPDALSWSNHQPLWDQVLERAARWQRGELDDPCRGRARHWGGTIDHPRGRMVPIDCGSTLNTFYGLAPRKAP